MKIVSLLILSYGIMLSPNISHSQELADIIAGAGFGDMAVVSGQGNINYSYARVDSLSERALQKDNEHLSGVSDEVQVVIRNTENFQISFAFSGVKVRCDEVGWNYLPSGRRYVQEWKWAYDGEKLAHYSLDGIGQNGLIIPKGSIRTESVPRIVRFDPRFNGLKIMDTPVGDFLNGTLGDMSVENISLKGEETIDGVLCNVITGLISGTADSITVWLAPGMMYRPKKIEYISLGEISVITNSFRNTGNGIWFPSQVQKDIYYEDSAGGNRILYSREIIAVNDDFQINIEILPAVFNMRFPKNMQVFDYRLGEKIKIK